jgi:hypothetical protein
MNEMEEKKVEKARIEKRKNVCEETKGEKKIVLSPSAHPEIAFYVYYVCCSHLVCMSQAEKKQQKAEHLSEQ